jgi:hypothetical protein
VSKFSVIKDVCYPLAFDRLSVAASVIISLELQSHPCAHHFRSAVNDEGYHQGSREAESGAGALTFLLHCSLLNKDLNNLDNPSFRERTARLWISLFS